METRPVGNLPKSCLEKEGEREGKDWDAAKCSCNTKILNDSKNLQKLFTLYERSCETYFPHF